MTGAAVLRFHCPACGAGLRAGPADGGTVVPCPRCGESVRAPRSLPAREVPPADAPAVSRVAALRAASGCRLLQAATGLVVLQAVVAAGGVGAWVLALGPAAVFAREPGELRPALLALWAAELLLVAAHTAAKLLGYARVRPAAAAVGSAGWVRAGGWAAVARAAGSGLTVLPWVVAPSLVWQAVGQVGQLLWLGGLVFEFAAVVVWYRLLAELAGVGASRRVGRYLTACGAAYLSLSAGLTAALVSTVAAVRRATPDAHVPAGRNLRLNFAALPADGFIPAGVWAAAALSVGLVLAVLYVRLLRDVRRALVVGG